MADVSTKKPRPKNLDLPTIRLPLPGILSILHRISGVILFLFLPVLLWLFQQSLATPESYGAIRAIFSSLPVKLVFLVLTWLYLHHFCAGIRYLLLDLHKGIELAAARASSKLVFVVSITLTLIVAAKVLL